MARPQTAARERRASEENDCIGQVLGKTKRGKHVVVGQDTNGYYYIKFTTGGQLPKVLRGRFRRYEDAALKVQVYLEQGK